MQRFPILSLPASILKNSLASRSANIGTILSSKEYLHFTERIERGVYWRIYLAAWKFGSIVSTSEWWSIVHYEGGRGMEERKESCMCVPVHVCAHVCVCVRARGGAIARPDVNLMKPAPPQNICARVRKRGSIDFEFKTPASSLSQDVCTLLTRRFEHALCI